MTFRNVWRRRAAHRQRKTASAVPIHKAMQIVGEPFEWEHDSNHHVLAMRWQNTGYVIWCCLPDDDGYCKTIPHPVKAIEATVVPFRLAKITCLDCLRMIATAADQIDYMWKPKAEET